LTALGEPFRQPVNALGRCALDNLASLDSAGETYFRTAKTAPQP